MMNWQSMTLSLQGRLKVKMMTWILTLLLFDRPELPQLDLDFDLVHAEAQGHGAHPDGLLVHLLVQEQ